MPFAKGQSGNPAGQWKKGQSGNPNGRPRIYPKSLKPHQTPRGKARNRWRSRWYKYGLTKSDFDKIFAKQGGKCPICGNAGDESEFVVDHCHKTGIVRGLLHNQCNTALGLLRDDPAIIYQASAYLEKTNFWQKLVRSGN